MTNEQLQKMIYDLHIAVDELGNAYILPIEGGYQFSPLKEKDIPNCVVITKDELIGLLERTLIFNPTTLKCEVAPKRFIAEKARIKELKDLLDGTDYQAIKYLEGVITAEEYEETKQKRIAWRKEINELEAIINA